MTRDISSGFEWVLSSLLSLMTECFNTLDSITFRGISILDFLITIFIIGIVLPLIITLLKSAPVESRSYYKREKRSSERRSEDE